MLLALEGLAQVGWSRCHSAGSLLLLRRGLLQSLELEHLALVDESSVVSETILELSEVRRLLEGATLGVMASHLARSGPRATACRRLAVSL